MPSQTFAFGQVEGAEEAIATNVERAGEAIAPNVGERAGNGGGDQDGGDKGGTTSGGSVDSVQVNSALLAVKSQYMRQNRRKRNGDSPMPSEPPIQHAECPFGPIRPRC